MSAQIKDGGPAFPCEQHETQDNTWNQTFESGMTLRDYFAAKCVAAMVSTIRSDDGYSRAKKIAEYHGMDRVSDWFAHDAYKQADAMLRAREVQS
jgi:hypothetical protein